MAGNTFGQNFTVTTFGESHGPALGAIIDGCPPGIMLTAQDIQVELDRRKPGQSKFTTQRKEPDEVEILSGVFEGKTTGTPIGLVIKNQDQRSKDYGDIKNLFRPGHADYTYLKKYGIRDHRGGGRSSARETAMRVAAGAIAKKVLRTQWGVDIYGFVAQLGKITVTFESREYISQNPFFIPNLKQIAELEAEIHRVRKLGDSIGAKVTVMAQGLPAGWGEPVFDRLDADIAKALMSINAVKGVEIGDGFTCVSQQGSEHRDEMCAAQGFLSNHAGGVLGGISTGQDIIASVALKPTSSIITPGHTVSTEGKDETVITKGRHDPCVGIRAVPIAEAMLALVLVDHALRHRAQTGYKA